MLKECLNTKVCQCRTKEYRRNLTITYLILIKFLTCTIKQLNILKQLLITNNTNLILSTFNIKLMTLNLMHTCICCNECSNLICVTIINTLEILTASDWPIDWAGLNTKHALDLIHQIKWVICLTV